MKVCRLLNLSLQNEWIEFTLYKILKLNIKTSVEFTTRFTVCAAPRLTHSHSSTYTWLAVFVVSSQGGQWLSWRHAARLGHWDRSVFTRPHGPRGGGALRPVWRAAGGQRCLRLHGQSVGPRDRDLPPYAAGPHQQSVLITGEQLQSHIH